jgi:hypothetical protein
MAITADPRETAQLRVFMAAGIGGINATIIVDALLAGSVAYTSATWEL